MTIRYRVVFHPTDNRGNRAADALASSANGSVISNVDRFNEEGQDLALIEVPDDSADYLEELLEKDNRVVDYSGSTTDEDKAPLTEDDIIDNLNELEATGGARIDGNALFTRRAENCDWLFCGIVADPAAAQQTLDDYFDVPYNK